MQVNELNDVIANKMPIVLTHGGLSTLKTKPVVSPEARDSIFRVLKLAKSSLACMDEVANNRLFY